MLYVWQKICHTEREREKHAKENFPPTKKKNRNKKIYDFINLKRKPKKNLNWNSQKDFMQFPMQHTFCARLKSIMYAHIVVAKKMKKWIKQVFLPWTKNERKEGKCKIIRKMSSMLRMKNVEKTWSGILRKSFQQILYSRKWKLLTLTNKYTHTYVEMLS